MTTAIKKTTTNIQSRKGRATRKPSANVVNLFKPLSTDEARAELTRIDSMSEGESSAIIQPILDAQDHSHSGPEIIFTDEPEEVYFNLSADNAVTFTRTPVSDPKTFSKQLKNVTHLKRDSTAGHVSVTLSAFAETTERCRINSAGDKVCTGKYGKITKRCHTSGNGTETCTTY